MCNVYFLATLILSVNVPHSRLCFLEKSVKLASSQQVVKVCSQFLQTTEILYTQRLQARVYLWTSLNGWTDLSFLRELLIHICFSFSSCSCLIRSARMACQPPSVSIGYQGFFFLCVCFVFCFCFVCLFICMGCFDFVCCCFLVRKTYFLFCIGGLKSKFIYFFLFFFGMRFSLHDQNWTLIFF